MTRQKLRVLANQLLWEAEIVQTSHLGNYPMPPVLTNPLSTMFSGDDYGAEQFWFGLASLHIATRTLRDTRLDYSEFLGVVSAIRQILPRL